MRIGTFSVGAVLLGILPVAAEVPEQLVTALSAEAFAERERAQADLLAWASAGGGPAVRDLLVELRETDDPEVRARCIQVLRELAAVAYLGEDGAEGYLGISMDSRVAPLPGSEGARFGVIVAAVAPDTAAEKAGLTAGDIIVSVNGSGWDQPDAGSRLTETVKALKPGSEAVLGVMRGENKLELRARLGRRATLLDQRPGQDPAALERAEREAFFRRWLRENRPAG